MHPHALQFFLPRWGKENMPWDRFCRLVKDRGYHGFEYALPANTPEKEMDLAWKEAAAHGLQIILQHFDTYEPDFAKHYDLYNAWFEKVKSYPVLKINSQTGKDYYSFEQNAALIEVAAQYGRANKVEVLHETHRHKFAFAAHVTRTYLERLPSLKLTLDMSHWVCVAESLLTDQPEAVALALDRAEHIHARVGWPEGPQVSNLNMISYAPAINQHLSWWDVVVQRKKAANSVLTITTEFGPVPYLVADPALRFPFDLNNDQDTLNFEMKRMLINRYHQPMSVSEGGMFQVRTAE